MNLGTESGVDGQGLLKRIVIRSYAIPDGLSFGITHTARCRNSNRNEEILHIVEKTKPKVALEFEATLKGVMMTIGCDECGIDKNQTAGLVMENHSDASSFEQEETQTDSIGTGSLVSEHLITGNQGETGNGRTIDIGSKKIQANYSPSWPSSLDIGSSERSLYKSFKTDRSSDEDYIKRNGNSKTNRDKRYANEFRE